MTEPLVLTPAEVAQLLRLSEPTVRRLVRDGRLRSLAGVRHVLIPRRSVAEYVDGDCCTGTMRETARDGA